MRCVPMLHVPDVRSTVDWYVDVAGFSVAETYGDGSGGLSFAVLAFGDTQVMFNSGGRATREKRRDVDLYLYADGVDAIHARLAGRVDVIEAPHDTFYGMRELIVRDLNGFWVTFGETAPEEIAEGIPPVAIPAERLESYAGRYEHETGLAVLIRLQDGRLIAFPEEASPARLLPLDQTRFKPVGVADGLVSFESDGKVTTGLHYRQEGMQLQFTKVPHETE